MKKMYKKILLLTIILIILVQLLSISMVKAANFYIAVDEIPYSNKFVDLFNIQNQVYVALDENGDIWTWGSNSSGIFGDGSNDGTYRNLPKKLSVGTKFTQISQGGYWFWVALDVNGNIWGCGNNTNTQLGNGYKYTEGSSIEIERTLFQITSGTKFTKITAGYSDVLALDESGNIWGWGYNTKRNINE